MKNEHYKSPVKVNIISHVTNKLLLSLEACKALGYVREDFPAVINPKKKDEPGIRSTTPEFKGRQVRTRVSVSELALDGSVSDVSARRRGQQEKVAKYYDSSTKDLSELQIGQPVCVQHHVTKLWDVTGVIIRGDRRKRSYLVRVGKYKDMWRNRRFLQVDSSKCK